MNNKIEKKINPKDKSLDNKSLQSKKLLNKKKNNSGIFRNNYKGHRKGNRTGGFTSFVWKIL